MYTDATVVKEELSRRRKDKGLLNSVMEYMGGTLPEGWPENKAIATINRYVATARVEDMVFAHSAASIALQPFWPTYHAEQFILTNPEKVSCLRPRVQRPKLQISRSWLVSSHEQWVGRPIGSIEVNGKKLQQVHDLARLEVLSPEVANNVFDVSSWNHEQARRFGATTESQRLAPHYYHAVMGLYIYHGVLFEDFDGGPNASSGLDGFVQEVVVPAIQSVAKLFGLQPLIVRLPYAPGFLDFPAPCGPVFDQLAESTRSKRR